MAVYNPRKNIPLQRVVNRLLSDVQERLPDCRRSWLMPRRTCLENQWAVVSEPAKIALLAKPTQSAKQIAEAQYDPANEQLHVVFRDGTMEEVKLR
jgi:hypothetical protein